MKSDMHIFWMLFGCTYLMIGPTPRFVLSSLCFVLVPALFKSTLGSSPHFVQVHVLVKSTLCPSPRFASPGLVQVHASKQTAGLADQAVNLFCLARFFSEYALCSVSLCSQTPFVLRTRISSPIFFGWSILRWELQEICWRRRSQHNPSTSKKQRKTQTGPEQLSAITNIVQPKTA